MCVGSVCGECMGNVSRVCVGSAWGVCEKCVESVGEEVWHRGREQARTRRWGETKIRKWRSGANEVKGRQAGEKHSGEHWQMPYITSKLCACLCADTRVCC